MTIDFKKEDAEDFDELMRAMGQTAREAGRALGRIESNAKNKTLRLLADRIRSSIDTII